MSEASKRILNDIEMKALEKLQRKLNKIIARQLLKDIVSAVIDNLIDSGEKYRKKVKFDRLLRSAIALYDYSDEDRIREAIKNIMFSALEVLDFEIGEVDLNEGGDDTGGEEEGE